MQSTPERLLSQAAAAIARRDAEILLAAAWQRSRAQLLVSREPVPPEVAARFAGHCARRAAGEPMAYLLGRREFWSLNFEVTPEVLVPRPETELLVERVLRQETRPTARVADLGTGSGAIAISLAHERPAWKVTGTDRDWFEPLSQRRFESIASNPPYIAADDAVLEGDGLRHEPLIALSPGGDGLGALTTLINEAPAHLVAGGWLFLEHGAGQAESLRAALVARGFAHVTSHRDLAGHERVTEGFWP